MTISISANDIRGDIKLNLQNSSCVKTELLLRTQSTPNETYIHNEEKMYSVGVWISQQIFHKWWFNYGNWLDPSQIFQNLEKKIFGKFLVIQKIIIQWSSAWCMFKNWYSGKFSSKKFGLFTFGLYTLILDTDEGRFEQFSNKVSELKGIHKNWVTFQTLNANEMKAHLMLFRIIYQWIFSVNHV